MYKKETAYDSQKLGKTLLLFWAILAIIIILITLF
jgi:hypothetical protein